MIKGLPERLKAMRMKYCLSQKEVAQMLDISPSIVSGYETGERTPSAENLLALAYLYKCTTDYLLGKERDEPAALLNISHLSPLQIQLLSELVRTMDHK